jgi:putative RNA 2'-phosphotransferase
MNKIELSKYLSFVLRHKPEDCCILLDNQGWTDLDILIKNLNDKDFDIDLSDIQKVVDTDSKNRFTIKDNKIKANQGHSIEGIIAFDTTPKIPPNILYHGTTLEKWNNGIKQNGLLKMDRHHVHLSMTTNAAKIVAIRWKNQTPIILQIDSQSMMSDHDFFVSENNVWLTDHVPAKFISNLINIQSS